MKRPTELIEKAKGFKSTDPIRVLAEYAVSLESPRKTVSDAVDLFREWKHDGFDYLFWHDKLGFIYRESMDVPDCYVYVCTREEFEAEVERRKGEESIDKKAEWYAIEVNKLFTAAKKDGIKLTRTDHGTIWEVIKPPISKAEIEKLREYAKWTSKQESDFVCDLVEKFINEHEVK